MAIPRTLRLVVVAAGLSLGGCAGASLCEAAGGTYAGSTCTRWSATQETAAEWCQANGGVYLGRTGALRVGIRRPLMPPACRRASRGVAPAARAGRACTREEESS